MNRVCLALLSLPALAGCTQMYYAQRPEIHAACAAKGYTSGLLEECYKRTTDPAKPTTGFVTPPYFETVPAAKGYVFVPALPHRPPVQAVNIPSYFNPTYRICCTDSGKIVRVW